MELKFELSSLVYSELYRILSEKHQFADLFYSHLSQVDLYPDWFAQAHGRYEAKWKSELNLSPDASAMHHLDSWHAQFASWIMASLRGTGQCFHISQELRDSVTSRYLEEVKIHPM